MLYAKSINGEKILPTKHQTALCPLCENLVISKCGEIKSHHWAHKSIYDCDTWHDPETIWHLIWKSYFPKECVEVTLDYGGPRHRADIFAKGLGGHEWVIELQNSPISTSKIIEREIYYGNMIWIFHIPRYQRHYFSRMKGSNDNSFSFSWLRMRPSWLACKSKIYVDFDMDKLLLINKLHYGWGQGCFISKNSLIYGYGGRPNIKSTRTGGSVSPMRANLPPQD